MEHYYLDKTNIESTDYYDKKLYVDKELRKLIPMFSYTSDNVRNYRPSADDSRERGRGWNV